MSPVTIGRKEFMELRVVLEYELGVCLSLVCTDSEIRLSVIFGV